jgi:hypothetical protein
MKSEKNFTKNPIARWSYLKRKWELIKQTIYCIYMRCCTPSAKSLETVPLNWAERLVFPLTSFWKSGGRVLQLMVPLGIFPCTHQIRRVGEFRPVIPPLIHHEKLLLIPVPFLVCRVERDWGGGAGVLTSVERICLVCLEIFSSL